MNQSCPLIVSVASSRSLGIKFLHQIHLKEPFIDLEVFVLNEYLPSQYFVVKQE